jgi:hypothetical protein
MPKHADAIPRRGRPRTRSDEALSASSREQGGVPPPRGARAPG